MKCIICKVNNTFDYDVCNTCHGMRKQFRGVRDFMTYISCVHSNLTGSRPCKTIPVAKLCESFGCKPRNSYQQFRDRSISLCPHAPVLDPQTVRRIKGKKCIYCGKRPASGMDRPDSRMCYSEDDDPCCLTCNLVKGVMRRGRFRRKVEQIARAQELV